MLPPLEQIQGGWRMNWIGVFSLILASQLFALGVNVAPGQEPACETGGADLGINNSQILQWKKSTRNSFEARGHVKGPLTRLYSDRNGHAHFQIQIGNSSGETLEVIYNEAFGSLPDDIEVGVTVEACGDYITSNSRSGPYPASPDGAIIHWVHMNPQHSGHPSGFLIIGGVLFGMDAKNAGPKPYPNRPHNRYGQQQQRNWR